MKKLIRNRLVEYVEQVELTEVGEESNGEEGEEDKSGETSGKYERIRNLLSNNIFNHAGVMEKLWGDSGATNRSLFRKKLNRLKSDQGGTYEFDEDEISKIVNILMDTQKEIRSAVGKKKK
jgi:hypothetical protein